MIAVESLLNLLVISVESDLSLAVIAVESLLNLLVISVESALILFAKAVESERNFVLKSKESLPILSFILVTLSVKAEPAEVVKLSILRDKETVSRANLLVNIFAVSDIFNLRFILPFNKLAVSLINPCNTVESDLSLAVIAVESDLSLVVITVESNNIFALKPVVLSPSAVPVEFVNLLILLDKLAVSRANLDVSMVAVSDIFNLRLILPFNKLAVSLIKPCKTVESALSLDVIAVESFLNLVVIAVESLCNFNVIAVESLLNFVVIAVESALSLVVIAIESALIFDK